MRRWSGRHRSKIGFLQFRQEGLLSTTEEAGRELLLNGSMSCEINCRSLLHFKCFQIAFPGWRCLGAFLNFPVPTLASVPTGLLPLLHNLYNWRDFITAGSEYYFKPMQVSLFLTDIV